MIWDIEEALAFSLQITLAATSAPVRLSTCEALLMLTMLLLRLAQLLALSLFKPRVKGGPHDDHVHGISPYNKERQWQGLLQTFEHNLTPLSVSLSAASMTKGPLPSTGLLRDSIVSLPAMRATNTPAGTTAQICRFHQ